MRATEAPVEGPARLRATHIRDRGLSAVAGSPKGYRNVDWPIEIAKEAGRLSCKDDDRMFNAGFRFGAIKIYAEWLEVSEIRSGRDSTQADIVSGGGGYPITHAKAEAIKKLIATDSRMPEKDRTICRKLAEGHSLPYSVRQACGDDFVFAVAARVRDALDCLIQAIDGARANNWTFLMRSL